MSARNSDVSYLPSEYIGNGVCVMQYGVGIGDMGSSVIFSRRSSVARFGNSSALHIFFVYTIAL